MPCSGMERFRLVWTALNASLWFVPTLLVSLGIASALALVEAEVLIEHDLSQDWPRLFGAGAEGARGMLTAIATSMATVAGVVFSVTIVALSLAASQYSPRVLRNFMSDRPVQVVLGAFVSIFAYCLIVLRTIRGESEGAFVPSLAVLGGALMALLGIGLLIYFVHHVATAIQAPYIVDRIVQETNAGIDRLFPSEVGDESQTPFDDRHDVAELANRFRPVHPKRDGYLASIAGDRLVEMACRLDQVVIVEPRVGDFVTRGTLVLRACGDDELDDEASKALLGCFGWKTARDTQQDVRYGLQQLVDVALKALSPSTHDPTTAVLCVDHLGGLLKRLSSRRFEGPWRERDGTPRLWVRGPCYQEMVETALSSITHHAGSHVAVHESAIAAIEAAANSTGDAGRRAALRRRLAGHSARLATCDLPASELERLASRINALRMGLMSV